MEIFVFSSFNSKVVRNSGCLSAHLRISVTIESQEPELKYETCLRQCPDLPLSPLVPGMWW